MTSLHYLVEWVLWLAPIAVLIVGCGYVRARWEPRPPLPRRESWSETRDDIDRQPITFDCPKEEQ